jgi:hypothetical protein
MDVEGAHHLRARIQAGVPIGAVIELVEDAPGDTGLRAGDRGIVREISLSGVVVAWERGFNLEIDPIRMPFRPAGGQ